MSIVFITARAPFKNPMTRPALARTLERTRRSHRAALAAAKGDEADRLMAEIDRISKQILELKQ